MLTLTRRLIFPRLCGLLLVLGLGLAACQPPAPVLTPTLGATAALPATGSATSAPTAASTQASSPTAATIAAATTTTAATATQPAATTPTAGGTPSPGTPSSGTATQAPGSTPVSGTVGADMVEFIADVTVPDGTDFTPNEAFIKTWEIKNAGTSAWTTDYDLVYVRGDQMGGPAALALPASVALSQTIQVSVNLTAPAQLGRFTGFWMLRTPSGKLFGLSADANQPLYVQIDVVAAAGASPQPTGPAGAITVSAAQMTVDQASRTGACPQAFQFSATFTSAGAGAVTYRAEAAADQPDFAFDLPDSNTSNFAGAGPRDFAVAYSLQFSNSVGGQVWLHVLSPNDLLSNKVTFSLTCQS